MKYLFENIQTVNGLLQDNKRILLLTDYDGTLTPIRESPDHAILSEEIQQLLIKISSDKSFFLGIITGRSLKEIKRLMNIHKALYAANHGIEMEGPGIRFVSPEAKKARCLLWHVYMRLQKTVGHVKGIYLEDKGLTISLHYRSVKKAEDVEYITQHLCVIIQPFLERKMLLLSTGKMVYEIRPAVKWNKASTITWLLNNYFPLEFLKEALLIYLGDDNADIEVFSTLKGKGLTVFVGDPSDTSAADYYVQSAKEVNVFLEHLYEQKKDALP